ncbi:MAG: alpha/beta fold hydrolase [Planctomycetaceae bacterium]|jgi:haloalkane dehalogenase|nr:alpha/beta fold hydrolase [Planctomycetaceae bacterium]
MAKKKKNEIWRPQYPFRSNFHNINGLRMHYLDEGKGTPILFVHGNPTWSFYWRNLILPLRKTYRCVAVDHVGCGLSDKPSEKAYPFTLERRIDDLCQMIERLNLKKITLIAHDWGGAIGMGAAERLPERFEKFVLMNTAAFISSRCPFRIRVCRMPFLGRWAVQGWNAFAVAATRMAMNNRKKMTREIRAGLLSPYNSWANRLAVYRFVKDIPLSPKHPSYSTLLDIEKNLPMFREKPLLLIWGMHDWCFSPEFLKRFLQIFPDAETHRFDDAGHYVVEDASERMTPIIEMFLSSKKRELGDCYAAFDLQ